MRISTYKKILNYAHLYISQLCLRLNPSHTMSSSYSNFCAVSFFKVPCLQNG